MHRIWCVSEFGFQISFVFGEEIKVDVLEGEGRSFGVFFQLGNDRTVFICGADAAILLGLLCGVDEEDVVTKQSATKTKS